MLRLSLYGFTLLCGLSGLQADSRLNCSEICYAGGMACMRVCTEVFKDEVKKCENICEYSDKVCKKTCLDKNVSPREQEQNPPENIEKQTP